MHRTAGAMEGHGTDCYVYISRIEDNVLPT